MPFLSEQWQALRHAANPPRRYSSQREFEADWVGGLRRRYNLSQEALASLASVSVTTVQNWENPGSHKHIAEHNQNRLRDIERGLWIQSHVTLIEPCPPAIRALYDLLVANKDASAQGLADYLVNALPADDPERARLLHWAGLAHSIADPASPRARHYQSEALRALGARPEATFASAMENEILGSLFEDLMRTPGDTAHLRQRGAEILAACLRLYARDAQPAYLWNALEVACRTQQAASEHIACLNALIDALGTDEVRRKVMHDPVYSPVRTAFATPAAALN